MIILTVNPEKENKEHQFTESIVSIGSSPTGDFSLKIDKEQLQEQHVKIIREGNSFYSYNVANDPFVTLNDVPFGKREIKDGDILQIGKTIISFQSKSPAHEESNVEESSPPLTSTLEVESLLDNKIQPHTNSKDEDTTPELNESEIDNTLEEINKYLDNLPSEVESNEEEDTPLDEEIDEEISSNQVDIDIESLVKEVEKLEIPDNENASTFDEEENSALEEDDDFDEQETAPKNKTVAPQSHENKGPAPKEAESKKKNPSTTHKQEKVTSNTPTHFILPTDEPKHRKKKTSSKTAKWKMWTALVILFITTGSIIFNGTYSKLKETSTKSEIEAAREVSDIALALTYAQINHIQPQQQNWTDPIFLTNSIRSVLTGHHKPYGTIDNHGHIVGGKYLLRIYNNRDMTRFIVIAQPEASLTQWVAPQKAIVIDSSNMVLHRVNDLRTLNRLLVNVNSLSGESGKAITDLIESEEILPMAKLANKHNQNGFAPPKQLELMRIGAENYVYNSPRYSQIGERIMESAIDLVSRPATTTELKKLDEEARLVAKLPDAVLYTSRGMKSALKAQKALTTLLPEHSFLIGYLQFDDEGKMKGSHLIFDLEAPKRAHNHQMIDVANKNSNEVGGYHPLILAANASEYLKHSQYPTNQPPKSFHPSVDSDSPLFLQVNSISKERQDKLQEISRQIIDLIHKNNFEYVDNFNEQIKELIIRYQSESEDSNKHVVKKLQKLYREYDFMPMSEFSEYVKAAGLQNIAKSHLNSKTEEPIANKEFTEEDFAILLTKINESNSFEELYDSVTESSQQLRIENVSNTTQLISYQNKLRTQVLQTLNDMLLSPDRHISQEELSDDNRVRLSQILIHSWVSDPEEQNFYLTEYDNLIEPR